MFQSNRQQACWAVGIAGWLLICAADSTGDVITYLSSQRFVRASGDGPSQVDATGFNDFSATLTNFTFTSGQYWRTRAIQTSRLLPDRIEASTWAETDYFTGPAVVQAIGASSLLRVIFQISTSTPYSVYFGPIFQRTDEGAGVDLRTTGGIILVNVGTGFGGTLQPAPIFGTLPPGTYQFTVSATAGSRSFLVGQAAAIGTLVVPSVTSSVLPSIGFIMCFARRRLSA